jgi:Flp pilus assembly protein TadG
MRGRAPCLHPMLRDEAGGATVLGVFALMLAVIFVGFAIDASNLYRHQAMMRLAADAAAHAGVVVLARGGTAEEAEAAAADMLEANLPARRFGRLVADPATDLRALAFDAASGQLAARDRDRPANAMLVRLQRSAAVDNPVPTYVLRLVGLDSWTAGAVGVAALVTTRRCANGEGFFARGEIALSRGVELGPGFCLHSQDRLALPWGPAAGAALRASQPALANCEGPCAEVGTIAMNLVMPDAADHVRRLAEGFARPGTSLPEKAAFFATRSLGEDLEPLSEVGLDPQKLRRGDVVEISPFLFSALRTVPPGLVYLVTCNRPASAIPLDSIERISLGLWEGSPAVRDIALVTSCPLTLGPFARIEGSLVIALHDGAGLAMEVAPGARIGGPREACGTGNRSQLMTPGNLDLPAGLAGSGLGLVAGGNVTVLRDGTRAGGLPLYGPAIHASGTLRADPGQHFMPCLDAATDPVLPRLQVITHAMPPLDGWVAPLVLPQGPAPDMPGKAADGLKMAGSKAGS